MSNIITSGREIIGPLSGALQTGFALLNTQRETPRLSLMSTMNVVWHRDTGFVKLKDYPNEGGETPHFFLLHTLPF